MLFLRFYKPRDYTSYLTHSLPAALPGRLWPLLCHFIRLMPLGFGVLSLASIASQASGIFMAWGLKHLIDGIATLPPDAGAALWQGLLAARPLILLLFVRLALPWLQWAVSFRVSRIFNARVQSEIQYRLIRQDVQFFEARRTGRVLQKVNALAGQVVGIYNQWLWDLGPSVFFFIGAFILLADVSLGLAIFMTLWFLLFFRIAYVIGARVIRPLSVEVNELNSQVAGWLFDMIRNIRIISLFDRRRQEFAGLAARSNAALMADQRLYLATINVRLSNQVMGIVVWLAFILYGVYGWSKGQVSAGELAMLSTIAIMFLDRATGLAESFPDIVNTLAIAQDNLDLLSTPPAIADQPGAVPLANPGGAIAYRRAGFGYPDSPPLLHDFSLDIPAGQKLGLVGLSGVGKTTLVNLLLRLYDVDAGAVTIGGQAVRDITQASLYGAISLVPQDLALFHRTIGENIGFGQEETAPEDIVRAARQAGMHDFIAGLPQQYDTLVGEGGIRLSGGQRQRIAIARAFLKDAPILILDEPTAALDSESEQLIQDSLSTLMQGRTVITIAHRLSTLAHLDRIVVLDQGRIIEDGTHTELLALGGLYARLWRLQSEGFLGQAEKTPR